MASHVTNHAACNLRPHCCLVLQTVAITYYNMNKANQATQTKLDPTQTKEMDPKMMRKLIKSKMKKHKRSEGRRQRMNPASDEWSATGQRE